MPNYLKTWWLKRQAKQYAKKHWHLFADIFFIVTTFILAIVLIVIKQTPIQKVDTTPVVHIVKNLATSTEPLKIVEKINKTNICSGKDFSWQLVVRNEGSLELSNISLTPSFLNSNFFIGSLENNSTSSSTKINNNKIVIEKMAPGEIIELDLSSIIRAKNKTPRYIDWSLKIAYEENNQTRFSSHSLERLKIITDLKVKAAAYYHSVLGDQLGSGPIPPMVGLPTNYWIFFEIDNQGNNLNNLVVSAKLPEAVTLSSGKTLSSGELDYDETQKRITWSVRKTEINNGRYQAGFEVQLLPTVKQIGLEPLLLTNISYIATDAYTNEKLSGKISSINSNLPLDVINQGQGEVIE